MKVKCVKLECEVCNRLASTQIFYNKGGVVKYARARHYLSRVNSKPQFEYHQQSLEYIPRKLGELSIDNTEIGHSVQCTDVDHLETKWSWGWELNPYITALQAVA